MLYTGDIGNYYYGQGHPMKPQRIRMCHNLLLNYGLYRKMEIYVSMEPILMLHALLILSILYSHVSQSVNCEAVKLCMCVCVMLCTAVVN